MSSIHLATSRQQAVQEINARIPVKMKSDQEGYSTLKISDFFGVHTLDMPKLKAKLSKDIYQRLIASNESGKKLELEVANAVATAAKEWAIEKGVTHFCHWFQPMTGSTAEKHDAFLSFDDKGRPVEKLTGAQLIQSEPDASSFPSGGMRTTFEARGYTAWDPTSPIFIMESTNTKTLCIPSAFISYHGDALDEKTVLMRSNEALSSEACELLKLLGDQDVKRIQVSLGTEQEYFLIDRAFYSLRPDLVMCGRTLTGTQPPRGQQMEDHYFGTISSRVLAFMGEVEFELYKLGVPVKTRHNEVAPHQFETAPIFEEANRAIDHNQLTMELLRKVARKHHFECLLHEKPFALLNGSGKHCNWSMQVNSKNPELDGSNLLDPGQTPQQNLRFLLFLGSVLKAVQKHSGLLRAGIASCANDHRLGGNEAPPAIISVFLGELLSGILDRLESGVSTQDRHENVMIELGVSNLPRVAKDNTDRNRTSPFAFTGNKFEFRAVGSSASPAIPIAFLNAAVAEALQEVRISLSEKMKQHKTRDGAILELLKELARDTRGIRFEGNGYSEEWKKEAAHRGLPALAKTPEALAQLLAPHSRKLLLDMKVFSEAELQSRFNVRIERYIKQVMIEAESLIEIVSTSILPSAYEFRAGLVGTIESAKKMSYLAPEEKVFKEVGDLIEALLSRKEQLQTLLGRAHSIKSEPEVAHFLSRDVFSQMETVREQCDQLERLLPDAVWPLPKYREMLFLS